MAFRSSLVLVAVATVNAWDGCYGGTACTSPNGCCDCSMTEAECVADGKSWMEDCTSQAGANMCATGTPVIFGCYVHPSGCDCSISEASCTGTWYDSCLGSGGSKCDERAPAVAPPSPPAVPPSPPRLPPSPPQRCIPQDQSKILLPIPTAPEDPINEPCYSHQSCREFVPGTGATTVSGYVCCVPVDTCDNLVSASARYYEGGCMGTNYKYNASYISSTSTSTTFPSTTEGCTKQGECALPYLEHLKHWTSRGVQDLEHQQPSDAVMDRLLQNAVESYSDACRAADLYPRQTVTASHHVKSEVTITADIASFTTAVLTAMEQKVAQEMRVAPGNVDITASGGSVVLTINIGFESAAAAATGATTMASAMSDTTAAATMLSTEMMTVNTVTTVSTPASGAGSSAPAPPLPAAPPPAGSSGLSVGVIAGIAVGCSVAVMLVVGSVIFIMMQKKKKSLSVAPTKG